MHCSENLVSHFNIIKLLWPKLFILKLLNYTDSNPGFRHTRIEKRTRDTLFTKKVCQTKFWLESATLETWSRNHWVVIKMTELPQVKNKIWVLFCIFKKKSSEIFKCTSLNTIRQKSQKGKNPQISLYFSTFSLNKMQNIQDRQCMCTWKIDPRSRNICFCAKARSVTYSEFVSVALVSQHAKCLSYPARKVHGG
jgi:hypothetical protein